MLFQKDNDFKILLLWSVWNLNPLLNMVDFVLQKKEILKIH